MTLIAQLNLMPTPEQHAALLRTLAVANAACNVMSETAWQTQTYRQFDVHKLAYESCRDVFGLSAQLTVRCLSKGADAYTLDRTTKRTFRPHGSIAYDDRILRWNLHDPSVSIWTVNGRQSIPFVAGERQMELLRTRKGETDRAYVTGAFYLLAVCDVEAPTPWDVDGTLGVDLGVPTIAADSDGNLDSGKAVVGGRHRRRRLRTKRQTNGTQSAKRKRKHLRGKERRFATAITHQIAKQLVWLAERTQRQIAVEDLTHSRTRVRARRQQRATLHSWAFGQWQQVVSYKAHLRGIPVHVVDPRNTSRTGPAGGQCAKENRKTQAQFLCTSCGDAGNADVIAAGNISRRAAVNPPYASAQTG